MTRKLKECRAYQQNGRPRKPESSKMVLVKNTCIFETPKTKTVFFQNENSFVFFKMKTLL